MVEISSEELKDYRKIGSGVFGSVYQVNDEIAYKIYHDKVKTNYSDLVNNPMLKERMHRINTMLRKNKHLKYTDLIRDYILVDGKFKGVEIPYYDGLLINKKINDSFDTKIRIVRELLRNAVELTDNYICNTDFKMNNIMDTSDGVKIIDLDDLKTKYSPLLKNIYYGESVYCLFDTIKSFMENRIFSSYPRDVAKLISKPNISVSSNYTDISNYLYYLSIVKNIVLVDHIISEEEAKEIKEYNLKVIYIHNNPTYVEDFFKDIVNMMQMIGIDLYDFVREEDIDSYLYSNNCKVRKLIHNS